MMYKIYSDTYLLYDGIDEDLILINPKLSQEINKTSTFTFEIYPQHIHYDKLSRLKSLIKIYRDDELIFNGRFIDDVIGFYNQRQVTCEGSLSFFVDSIIRPYTYPESEEAVSTVEGLLEKFISEHNEQVEDAKKIYLGTVTVTDPNDYIVRSTTDHLTTYENIQTKLVDMLDGYLIFRFEEGEDGEITTYIDYLSEITTAINQDIEFAINLLDYKCDRKGDEIFTAIIPLGDYIIETETKVGTDEDGNEVETETEVTTDNRLTIESVNDGIDYIVDEDGAEQYGLIFKTVIWEDVTEATNLYTKGLAEVESGWQISNSIELSAVDLSNAGLDVGYFSIGNQIKVISEPHGLDEYYLISKLETNLLDPSQDKLTLGRTFMSLTEQNKSENESIKEQITVDISHSTDKIEESIFNTERQMTTEIATSADGILTTVKENYWSQTEHSEYAEEVSAQLSQTAEQVQITISAQSEMQNQIDANKAVVESIEKDFTFSINGMTISCKDLVNPSEAIETTFDNDSIVMSQGGESIFTVDGNTNTVTIANGNFTQSLKIGGFGCYPETDLSLSFRK